VWVSKILGYETPHSVKGTI